MATTNDFTRVNNDTNGNPRYAIHFYHLLTENESDNREGFDFVSRQYNEALQRAKKIGGKKFHNKQFGGGIVFQSYNLHDTIKDIKDALNDN